VSGADVVYLLMILNVDAYAGVVLERSLCTDECHIGDDESVLTMVRRI